MRESFLIFYPIIIDREFCSENLLNSLLFFSNEMDFHLNEIGFIFHLAVIRNISPFIN